MRRLVIVLLCLASSWAYAKPKVAVTPIKGDTGGKVAAVVVEALEENAKVTDAKETKETMEGLGMSGELEPVDAKKLQTKLGVTALVQGELEKKGTTKRILHLTVWRGKKSTKFSAEYKTTPSEKVKRALRDELAKRIEPGGGDDDDKPEEPKPEDKPKPFDDTPKRRVEDDKPKRRVEDDKPKRRVAADDDDKASVRKKKKKKKKGGDDSDDEESVHAPMPLAHVFAGATAGVRRLTYTAANPAQRVGTFAGSARVEGELFPFAGDKSSPAGNIGLIGELDKTLGLSITVPAGTVPINQAHYSVGLRYRIPVGTASVVALDASYATRHYIADRSNLMNPVTDFDAPDVDYKAITPGIGLRTPLSPTMALFAHAEGMLILDTGAIQKTASYGSATVYGLAVDAGIEIALNERFTLAFAAEVSQISFSFKGTGDVAMARGVTAATDRSYIAAAMLGVTY